MSITKSIRIMLSNLTTLREDSLHCVGFEAALSWRNFFFWQKELWRLTLLIYVCMPNKMAFYLCTWAKIRTLSAFVIITIPAVIIYISAYTRARARANSHKVPLPHIFICLIHASCVLWHTRLQHFKSLFFSSVYSLLHIVKWCHLW